MKYLPQITIITFTLLITIGPQVTYGVSNCRCTGDVPLVIQNSKKCCESDNGEWDGVRCRITASNGDATKQWNNCCAQSPIAAPVLTCGDCSVN